MEIVYDIVMGWVMVFDFIHLKEGPTRLKMFLYYTIILLETIALMTIWYLQLTNHVSTVGIWNLPFLTPVFLVVFRP